MATEYLARRNGSGQLSPAGLPSAKALLRAFREPADPAHPDHCVLEAARALVRCHHQRARAQLEAHAPEATSSSVAACILQVDEIDGDREQLMERIDDWVDVNIPHRTGASLHTETLGAVIDRLAAKWVAAQHALGLPAPHAPQVRTSIVNHGVDGEAHLQWVRLAELADGYKDLVTDVAEHRRRLPVF